MRVTAAVVASRGAEFELRELELVDPGPGQVLVRIKAVGICQSDLSVKDYAFGAVMPIVLGHEGAGIVEKVGEGVSHVAPGDHVVLSYGYCGACVPCSEDAHSYCTNFHALNWGGNLPDGRSPYLDGETPVAGMFFAQSSFSTYALALENNTVKVASDLPLEWLAPLGCGVQTGAGTVLNGLKPPAGKSLAVFGAGSVGLSALMAAAHLGCTPLVAIDLDDGRLALAKELGATHTLRGDAPNLAATLREMVPGGLNYTVDTTGVPAIMRAAIDALAPRGTCALIAMPKPGTEASFMPGPLLSGRSIMGFIEGNADPQVFIPEMIDLHRAGRFPFEKLVTTFDFADINHAVAEMRSGRTIKPVLLMAEG